MVSSRRRINKTYRARGDGRERAGVVSIIVSVGVGVAGVTGVGVVGVTGVGIVVGVGVGVGIVTAGFIGVGIVIVVAGVVCLGLLGGPALSFHWLGGWDWGDGRGGGSAAWWGSHSELAGL